MADNEILRPLLRDVAWKGVSVSSGVAGGFDAGTLELDMTLGNVFSTTLTENVTTFSITNPPASGNYSELVLFMTQSATAPSCSFSFGDVLWLNDTVPNISALDTVVAVCLITKDAGTTWYGRLLIEESGATCIPGNDSDTKLLIHSNTTNGDTAFNDESASNHEIIKNGGITHSDAITAQFGTSSIYFDGTDDSLALPADHADWDFGSGNFTIDAWVYVIETGGMLISKYREGVDATFYIIINPTNWSTYFYTSGTDGYITANITPDLNAWTHVAIVRDGDILKLYINGVEEASGSMTGALTHGTTSALTIGSNDNTTPSQFHHGYLDEIRISKGIARWTANFTPPIMPYCNES